MPDSAVSPSAVSTSSAEAPRLNRRQAAKVRTRRKVMDAARALFAERGYDPATIRDIAKGAGMSTGAVFANFQDKAELFEAVLAEDIARLADVLETEAPKQGSVRERLAGALNALYHATLDQLPLVQAVVARAWFQPVTAETRLREQVQSLVQPLTGILQDGVGSGELRQDADVRLLSEMTWSAFVSNFRRAAYDGLGEKDLSSQASRQLDVILAGSLAR
jgi:AcrR family transcriptional regulator